MKYLLGASYDRHKDRWEGRITLDGKQHRKWFKTEVEAHEWYKEMFSDFYNHDRVRFDEQGVLTKSQEETR